MWGTSTSSTIGRAWRSIWPKSGNWFTEKDALPVDAGLLQNVFPHTILALVAVLFHLGADNKKSDIMINVMIDVIIDS